MSEARLPDFIVFGAVKAATTWIQAQLEANPDVFMPAPEPHFFSRDYDAGMAAYARWFADARGDQRVGEKSADYLAHPRAPGRIAAWLPDVRLVAQLRNPIDRAYSDYKMLYRRGTVRGAPEDYLSSLDNPQPRFLQDGLYARHLAHWFDQFDGDRILLILHEDVRRDPRGTVDRVSTHIGVAPRFSEQAAARRVNDGAARLLPLPLRTMLAPLKRSVAPLRGTAWFEGVRGTIARDVAYPPLSDALRARLADFYADDVERLSRMIGRPLDHWLTPRRAAA
ncbi:sulfotransferase [Hephaestia mangrovi]|uniref:sulfotransferase n=1 Tax=Hephaestia mangrovi TaxID=2873268 RepID=UPI001CA7049A|nr:sulfotransferase [Hephaestia mangrovi]MBY8828371.1 sulfotransferase domain-containing protein [Hephaestia mangrovi]